MEAETLTSQEAGPSPLSPLSVAGRVSTRLRQYVEERNRIRGRHSGVVSAMTPSEQFLNARGDRAEQALAHFARAEQDASVAESVAALFDGITTAPGLAAMDADTAADIAVEWVASVCINEPEDPAGWAWHASRLHGFGGSEVGALAAAWVGRTGEVESARGVVDGKLGEPPSPPSGDTRRGHALEDTILGQAMDRLGAKPLSEAVANGEVPGVAPDSEAAGYVDRIPSGSDPEYPWAAFSPDGPMWLPPKAAADFRSRQGLPAPVDEHGHPRGMAILVDAKAPRSDEGSKVKMDYRGQLAYGKWLYNRVGIPMEDVALAVFSVDDWALRLPEVDTVTPVAPKVGETEAPGVQDEAPATPRLIDQILAAGDYFWANHVQTATPIPPADGVAVDLETEALPEPIQERFEEVTRARAARKAAEDRFTAAEKAFQTACEEYGLVLPEGPLRMANNGQPAGVNLKVTAQTDTAALTEQLEGLGIEAESLPRKPGKADPEATAYQIAQTAKALAAAGMDLESFGIDPEGIRKEGALDDEAVIAIAHEAGIAVGAHAGQKVGVEVPRDKAGKKPFEALTQEASAVLEPYVAPDTEDWSEELNPEPANPIGF